MDTALGITRATGAASQLHANTTKTADVPRSTNPDPTPPDGVQGLIHGSRGLLPPHLAHGVLIGVVQACGCADEPRGASNLEGVLLGILLTDTPQACIAM